MDIRILAPLRVRDFRLLWSGQAISYMGNGVMTVALAFQTLAISPHPTSLSIVLAARTVPLLAFLLVGGAITDRLPRRAILIASDAGRAIVTAVAAILIATHHIQLWHLVVLSGTFGAAEAFFFPAFLSIVPEMLDGELLLQSNALESAIRPLTYSMAGPALGGLLVATVGRHWAFGFDSATFIASVICLVMIRTRSKPLRETTTTVVRDIADGFSYARSQAWFAGTLVMAAFALLAFVGPKDVLLPIYSRRHLGTGARGYGLLIAAMGTGGIAGAVTISQIGFGAKRMRNMLLIWGIGIFPMALLPFTRSLAAAMAILAFMGFAFEMGTVAWNTIMQDLVPAHLMGRARSLDFLLSFALMPASYALAGPLASRFGVLHVIGIGGAAASVVTFAFMAWPHMLDPDKPSWRPAAGSKAADRFDAASR